MAVGGGGTSCWREGYRRACGREAKRAATRMPLGVAGSSRVGRNAPAGVGFYLAQVVAQLGERIGLGGEAENTENRFTNLDDSPTTELRAPTSRSAGGTHGCPLCGLVLRSTTQPSNLRRSRPYAPSSAVPSNPILAGSGTVLTSPETSDLLLEVWLTMLPSGLSVQLVLVPQSS